MQVGCHVSILAAPKETTYLELITMLPEHVSIAQRLTDSLLHFPKHLTPERSIP